MTAGVWPLSFQQRLDQNGYPYVGAKATFLEAATLDPLEVWQNYDLTNAHSNPVEADGFGVFPAVFIDVDEAFYRFRITTADGVILTDLVQLPVVGPAAGAGPAASPVDPEALLLTGDTKWRLGTGAHSGWVRVNGRTIGSATSGASERANADTEALFTHIYGEFSDTLAPVSGGRGANASTDFAANKTITLPDCRGRTLAGLDDMGGAASGRLTTATVALPTTLGGTGGLQTHTLTLAESAAHDHGAGSAASAGGAHTHLIARSSTGNGSLNGATEVLETGGTIGSADNYQLTGAAGLVHDTGLTSSTDISHTHTVTVPSAGGGTAHLNLQPTYLATLYVKL